MREIEGRCRFMKEIKQGQLSRVATAVGRINTLLTSMMNVGLEATVESLWTTLISFKRLLTLKFMLRGQGTSLITYLLSLLHVVKVQQIYHSVIKTFVCEAMSELRKTISDRVGGLENVRIGEADTRALLELASDLQLFRRTIIAPTYNSINVDESNMSYDRQKDIPDEGSQSLILKSNDTNKPGGYALRIHSSSNIKHRLSACSGGTSSLHTSKLYPLASSNSSNSSRTKV